MSIHLGRCQDTGEETLGCHLIESQVQKEHATEKGRRYIFCNVFTFFHC